LFYLAIVAASRLGREGPGIIATVGSAVACMYFYIEPRFSLGFFEPVMQVNVALFLISGVGVSLLIGELCRVRTAIAGA
jgi:K+-sensing histidine kinase KdpD